MVQSYQVRESYAGVPAGISPVEHINAAVGKGETLAYQGLQKALDTTNRDTVLWVRELRRRLFITQAEMGKLLGVHAATVSSWEGGSVRPNDQRARDGLERLGAQYGMPPLPEARYNNRPHNGPYFPSTLEAEFKAAFGG